MRAAEEKSLAEITCLSKVVVGIDGNASVSCHLHHHSYDCVVGSRLYFRMCMYVQLLHEVCEKPTMSIGSHGRE